VYPAIAISSENQIVHIILCADSMERLCLNRREELRVKSGNVPRLATAR
jgi:hypothetical protein